MEEGDVAVSGPEPYVVADQPDTAPQLRIHPGGICEPLPGAPIDYSARLGCGPTAAGPRARRWLSAAPISSRATSAGDCSRRCLGPGGPGGRGRRPVMDMVLGEIQRDEPGQQCVLDRWLDLALITTLRAWFDRPDHTRRAGTRRRAIRSWARRCGCCTRTGAPWSVVELADAPASPGPAWPGGSPRSVGEAPMAYLTGWRITLAADLLRETTTPSSRSPAGSATRTPSPSVSPSNESAARPRPPTGAPRRLDNCRSPTRWAKDAAVKGATRGNRLPMAARPYAGPARPCGDPPGRRRLP